jgi:hypothetical protein
MNSFTISTINDFIHWVKAFPIIGGFVLYRGQACKGNLIPNIARKNPNNDTTTIELKMIEQVRKLGATLVEPSKSNLEIMILAQHFGLKTRLLDWTSNPLAALWFACSDTSSQEAYVYVLYAEDLLGKEIDPTDPFKEPETRVYQPRHNNARIVAQHGWFTLHRYAAEDGGFVPLELNPKMMDILTEIHVPAESKAEMINSLDRLGTNHHTLFPDLEGLCNHLNWKHLEA